MVKRGKKHSYYLSTLSIALVLFLLGIVGYIGNMVLSATDSVVEDIQMSLLLKEGVKESEVLNFVEDVKNKEIASKVEYLSKDKAAELYKSYTGEDFTMFLEENPLPASVEVTLKSSLASTEKLDSLAQLFVSNKLIDEVVRPKGVVDQVLGHIYKIKFILFAFMITLFFISVVLINNAIKMNIRSKRFLIRSMKLIGATDTFISTPFLGAAASQGFLASLMAWAMLAVVYVGVNRGLNGVMFVAEELYPITVIAVSLSCIGVMLSLICTSYALGKEINQNMNNLHTY